MNTIKEPIMDITHDYMSLIYKFIQDANDEQYIYNIIRDDYITYIKSDKSKFILDNNIINPDWIDNYDWLNEYINNMTEDDKYKVYKKFGIIKIIANGNNIAELNSYTSYDNMLQEETSENIERMIMMYIMMNEILLHICEI